MERFAAMSSNSWLPAQLTKVIQEPTFTSLVLATPLKAISIFVEPSVGLALQSLLTQQPPARPTTQDLLERLAEGFEIQLLRVLIYAMERNVFKARLIFEQTRAGMLTTVMDLDCRPSDAIQFALRRDAPIWVAADVVDRAGTSDETSI
jgi:bifunctional DNase/RNase